MRAGHNSLSRLEEGFEPDPEVHTVLIAIPQRQLIDEDGAEGEAPGVGQAFGWHLPVAIEDPFELLVEGLTRDRAQLVEEAADFYPVIPVRVAPILRRHQAALVRFTLLPQLRRVVVLIAQDKAHLGRHTAQQSASHLTVSDIRWG